MPTFRFDSDDIPLQFLSGLTLAGLDPVAPGIRPAQPSVPFQSFVDAIPFANDGDVITADHYNAIRRAIAQLAGSLDDTQLARVATLSFAPVLYPDARLKVPSWTTSEGFAVGPEEQQVIGWMPIELPSGMNIDRLTVRGIMPRGAPPAPSIVESWSMRLQRVDLDGSNPVTVCDGVVDTTVVGEGGAVSTDVPVKADGLTPAQLNDRRRIEPTRYRYLFRSGATMRAPATAERLQIRVVQVTCTRG